MAGAPSPEDLYILRAEPLPVRSPLTVTESGASWWPPSRGSERGRSTIMAVELVQSGTMRLTQDGRESLVGAGEVFVLKYGAAHRYRPVDGPLRKRFIGLAGVLAEQLTATLPDRVVPRRSALVGRLLSRIEACFRRRGEGWQLDAAAIAYRLLSELAAAPPGRRREEVAHPGVEAVLRLIDQHGQRPLPLARLAREAGISATHLNRLFHRAHGTTPLRYARLRVIDQARYLLSDSALSCRAIAEHLGYADPLYFSAVFKRLVGESPQSFRQRHAAKR